jgi:hypothetical protein
MIFHLLLQILGGGAGPYEHLARFKDPALTDSMDDFRKVRDDIESEITQLLKQVG